MFLTWGVSPDGEAGCLLDNIFRKSQQRLAANKADKSADRVVDFIEKVQGAAKEMADKAAKQRTAHLAEAGKDAPVESYEREYVNPPAYSYKSHNFDPLSGGPGSFPIAQLKAGIFGMFTGSVNGVKDPELAGEIAFTPLFIPVDFFTPLIPFYLEQYPNLPFSRAGQLNVWFAHDEESAY
jgi:hypothetical protein